MSYHEKKDLLTVSKQYLVQLMNRKLLAYIQAARVTAKFLIINNLNQFK